jgi:hypothetical protein
MINKHYDSQISAIKSALKKDNVVQLQEFLDKESYYKILSEIKLSIKTKLKEDTEIFDHRYKSKEFTISKDIELFLKKILGKKLKFKIIILGHKDYSLITNKKIEAILDFTEEWHNAWGGYLMFNDGEGNVMKIPSIKNSLTISNGKTFSSIKYLNNHAGKNQKIYLIGKTS